MPKTQPKRPVRKGQKPAARPQNKKPKTAPKQAPQTNPNDARGVLLGLSCIIVTILHFTGESNAFFT